MKLLPILENGTVEEFDADSISGVFKNVIESTKKFYEKSGFMLPWVCYIAVSDNKAVGTCAFKSVPKNNRIEIAYFTFPGNEGKGIATQMTRLLIDIAKENGKNITVFAQTLPGKNASTRILEKLNFRKIKEFEHPEDGLIWEWELEYN